MRVYTGGAIMYIRNDEGNGQMDHNTALALEVNCPKCGTETGTTCDVTGGAHAERINAARDHFRNLGKAQARRELAGAR